VTTGQEMASAAKASMHWRTKAFWQIDMRVPGNWMLNSGLRNVQSHSQSCGPELHLNIVVKRAATRAPQFTHVSHKEHY
jgi:hypothetical protein